jgi:hypothetical protein
MGALQDIALKLKIDPSWLWSLISFESKANPAARNKITGARGLIQFLHSTARELGYKDADDLVKKHPTFDSQLKTPVYNYLKKYQPFPTKQSLYMAVFFPRARTWAPGTLFPSNVRRDNPGIDTVQDYINYVEGKPPLKMPPASIVAAAILAAIGYFIYKTIKPT